MGQNENKKCHLPSNELERYQINKYASEYKITKAHICHDGEDWVWWREQQRTYFLSGKGKGNAI